MMQTVVMNVRETKAQVTADAELSGRSHVG